MKIIDAHAHIYERLSGFGPKGEARAIGGGMVEWSTGEKECFLKEDHGDTGFSPEKLIELMEEGHISHAVLLQGSNYGFQNSYTAEAVKKYPQYFTGAGTFDPYATKAKEIFENLVQNFKFKTLKFEISEVYGLCGYHPDLKIDGKILKPHFDAANALNLTIVIDTGVMGTKSFQIEELKKVAEKYSNINFVIAHTLFPMSDEKDETKISLIRELKKDNIFFDLAQTHAPKNPQPRLSYIRKVMDIVGSDHLTWGTDCPGVFMHYSYKELVNFILNTNYFKNFELENILEKTAQCIYHIKD